MEGPSAGHQTRSVTIAADCEAGSPHSGAPRLCASKSVFTLAERPDHARKSTSILPCIVTDYASGALVQPKNQIAAEFGSRRYVGWHSGDRRFDPDQLH